MDNTNNNGKERPLILIGPEGRVLRMQEEYQDPRRQQTLETEEAVLLIARPVAQPRQIELLQQIIQYIDVHLSEKITLQSVGEYFGMSISTVTQLFQRKTDTTFHQYLTRRRMAAAEQLIRSGTPLEEIGKQVGYTDHSSFYRAFKQTFGMSPREYRSRRIPE